MRPAAERAPLPQRTVQTYPRHYGGGVVERRENFGRTNILEIPLGNVSLSITSERRPESGIVVPTIVVSQSVGPKNDQERVTVSTIHAKEHLKFGPQFDFFTQVEGEKPHEEQVGTGGGYHVELALAHALSQDANLMEPHDLAGSWVSPDLVSYITSLSSPYARTQG